MMRNWVYRPALVFVVISLLVHTSAWISMYLLPPPKRLTANKPVEVEYITPEELAKNLKQQRIVEQDKQLNDEIDEKAKYLSAHNQRVEKQTRATQSGKFNNSADQGKLVSGTPEAPKIKPQKRSAETSKDKGELPSLAALRPQFSLTPNQPQVEAKQAGNPSQTDDYIKDVDKGIQTLLSTREFVYFSYYSRIKEKIRQYWEPNVRQKVKIIYQQGRTIASAKDRVTQVMITLDSNGQLEKIEIIGQSGVQDLDSAAIEAFRSAAPFPNPPKGMVESDGKIRIRWDFILEASSIVIRQFDGAA